MATILDEPPNNVRLAQFYVLALRALRGPNPQGAIDTLLRFYLPEPFSSAYTPPTNNYLGWYVGGNNQRKVILIDGTINNQQVVNLINGYNDASLPGEFAPVNGWLAENVRVIQNAMATMHIQDSEHLDFVGYSAGGAVAQILMWEYARTQSTVKRKLITFGAPRAQNSTRASLLSTSQIGRWMTDADPIPLVPPRALDMPLLIPLLTPLQIIRYGNYVHTDGGISVAENGITTPAVLPPFAAANIGSSLSGWLTAAENDPANRHTLDAYYSYLTAAVARLPQPSQQAVEEGPSERPQQDRQRDLTRRQREVMTAINAAGHVQNTPSQELPAETLMIPVRIGRIWYVSFNGEIILTAPIEKRARAIARAGNAFLRALPRQALVDTDSLTQQLTNWLAMAQDPTFGFVPQINTNLTV